MKRQIAANTTHISKMQTQHSFTFRATLQFTYQDASFALQKTPAIFSSFFSSTPLAIPFVKGFAAVPFPFWQTLSLIFFVELCNFPKKKPVHDNLTILSIDRNIQTQQKTNHSRFNPTPKSLRAQNTKVITQHATLIGKCSSSAALLTVT